MAENAKTRIILRNGTAARWTAKNPVLLPGESGIETDTKRQKYGDGVTPWNELEYAAGSRPTAPTAWGEIVGTLMAQLDLKAILDAKEATANRGKNGGYAPLNEEGKIPSIHLSGIFYKGMIMMWSGALADIPNGWALCDGQDGRPNLLGRFPRCVGNGSTQPGGTGGANTATLVTANMPAHTHGVSITSGVQSARHTHSVSGTTASYGHLHHPSNGESFITSNASTVRVAAGTAAYVPTNGSSTYDSTTDNHTHGISATAANETQNHTHTVSGNTGSVGSGTAFSVLPPYYDLAFIIKL